MLLLQSGCDLVDYLDAVRASPRGCLTNPQIHYIMRQLLTAINFMHIVGDKPLIHRDIKVRLGCLTAV